MTTSQALFVGIDFVPGQEIEFTYLNWRGETRQRRVVPISLRFGRTVWHPKDQWLLVATDAETGEQREFAIKDIQIDSP